MRAVSHNFAFAMLAGVALFGQNGGLQGQWKAQIQWNAQAKDAGAADILFQFAVAADGRIEGTFGIPQMGIEEVPITLVAVKGSEVQIQIRSLQVEFQGTLDSQGAEVAGTLRRNGESVPMRLTLVKRTLDRQPEPKPAPQEVVEWFRDGAIPLRTPEAGHGFEDMRPLREIVGNARIVSLGEATHGTREFFQLKHRLLEFLVTEMGFTVFAIEANWPESLALNNYVLSGKGDPVAALDGLHFWTCNSQEVLDMVLWMRRYNQDPAHPNKVKFFGFDMQFADLAVRSLAAFLGLVDPGAAEQFARAMEPLDASSTGTVEIRRLSDVQRRQIGVAAAELAQSLDRNREQYATRSSDSEWRLARRNADIVRQAANLADPAARDRFMAENVKWILDQEPPGAKIVLWAHNGHVATAPGAGQPVPMGAHLRRMYGDELVTLGFAFNQGAFRASDASTRRLREFTVRPAAASSLDGALAATGLPLFVVDLRKTPKTGPVAGWLMQEQRSREVGATYSDEWERTYQPLRITQSFDLLLFVERTSAAVSVAH
jgi:erythromycin esterase